MLRKIIKLLIILIFPFNSVFAADMGIELNKAEMALKCGYKYIQDKDLNIDK